MIYFIYLAAGNSMRFGEKNKLLQDFNGKAMFKHGLDTIISASETFEDIRIIAVTKYKEIAEYAEENDVKVVCENIPHGISHTIKRGIRAIECLKKEDYLVFQVSDQPFISQKTIESFILSAKKQVLTAAAYFNDKKGNPVMFSARLLKDLLELSGDIGGRHILKKHPPLKIYVENEYELFDIDDEKSLEKYNR